MGPSLPNVRERRDYHVRQAESKCSTTARGLQRPIISSFAVNAQSMTAGLYYLGVGESSDITRAVASKKTRDFCSQTTMDRGVCRN